MYTHCADCNVYLVTESSSTWTAGMPQATSTCSDGCSSRSRSWIAGLAMRLPGPTLGSPRTELVR